MAQINWELIRKRMLIYKYQPGYFTGGAVDPGLSYFLDTYTDAFVAVSTRQLSSTATYSMRIKRTSDSSEQDIGFVNGFLDTSSIASFCSGTTGHVVKFYDQSATTDTLIRLCYNGRYTIHRQLRQNLA
ncbi:MAG: hypothetical protein LC127_13805 [Chitinophagales bacterium]|nr:hypothetical protein [Chitinophagales bacterium]